MKTNLSSPENTPALGAMAAALTQKTVVWQAITFAAHLNGMLILVMCTVLRSMQFDHKAVTSGRDLSKLLRSSVHVFWDRWVLENEA